MKAAPVCLFNDVLLFKSDFSHVNLHEAHHWLSHMAEVHGLGVAERCYGRKAALSWLI